MLLDAWELSQDGADVCHFCDSLHQPHLSQRNQHIEQTPRAEQGAPGAQQGPDTPP